MRFLPLLTGLLLAGCSQPQTEAAQSASPPTTAPPSAGAAAQPEDPRLANYGPELANCAGAVAALAGIDVMRYPERDGVWEDLFGTLLALMDKEPPFPNGQTAREAVEAERARWASEPRASVEVEARACRTRFMGQ